MEKKKRIVILSVLLVLIIVGIIIFVILFNKKQEPPVDKIDEPAVTKNTYTAYVSINPLVKLVFEEKCKVTEKRENGYSASCEEPQVIDFQLLNEDAKNIYAKEDFKGGYLDDVLITLASKARDNGIVFEKVEVKSDWSSFNDYKEENDEIFNKYSFEIKITNRDELDILEEEQVTVTFTDDTDKVSKSINKGDTVAKPANPIKTGYTFVEWQLNGKSYDFNTPVNSNIELIAIWKKHDKPIPTVKYTVSFNSNGGSTISNQVVVSGNKVNKPNNPNRTGYTFVEWQLNGKSYDFNAPVNSNIDLVAKWNKVNEPTPTVKYKVTFNSNGGSIISRQEVESGSKATNPNIPVKMGYTFVEWQLNGKTYDFNSPVNSNIELIAIWKKNPYDYNLNDNLFYGFASVQFVISPTQSMIDELKNHEFTPVFLSGGFYLEDWSDENHTSSKGDYNWYEKNFKYEEISASTLSKIKKLKGVKFIDYDNQNVLTLEVMSSIYVGNTEEALYRNVSDWSESENGVIRLESFGNGDLTLLDEKACKEYNLSCGRW